MNWRSVEARLPIGAIIVEGYPEWVWGGLLRLKRMAGFGRIRVVHFCDVGRPLCFWSEALFDDGRLAGWAILKLWSKSLRSQLPRRACVIEKRPEKHGWQVHTPCPEGKRRLESMIVSPHVCQLRGTK